MYKMAMGCFGFATSHHLMAWAESLSEVKVKKEG